MFEEGGEQQEKNEEEGSSLGDVYARKGSSFGAENPFALDDTVGGPQQ